MGYDETKGIGSKIALNLVNEMGMSKTVSVAAGTVGIALFAGLLVGAFLYAVIPNKPSTTSQNINLKENENEN